MASVLILQALLEVLDQRVGSVLGHLLLAHAFEHVDVLQVPDFCMFCHICLHAPVNGIPNHPLCVQADGTAVVMTLYAGIIASA